MSGKDAIKYLKQVVGLVGSEVCIEKKEAVGNRYYKILPVKKLGQVSLDLEWVRKTLSKCLAQKYYPTTVQDEGSKSKWFKFKQQLVWRLKRSQRLN